MLSSRCLRSRSSSSSEWTRKGGFPAWLNLVEDKLRNFGKDARRALAAVRTDTPDGVLAAGTTRAFRPVLPPATATGVRIIGQLSLKDFVCAARSHLADWHVGAIINPTTGSDTGGLNDGQTDFCQMTR